jgi:hypothetical protein
MDLLPLAEIELEDLAVDTTADEHAVVSGHGAEPGQKYGDVLAPDLGGHDRDTSLSDFAAW